MLVKKIITRSQQARQNLIHAHIPVDQVGFYEGPGGRSSRSAMGSRGCPMAIISVRMPAILLSVSH